MSEQPTENNDDVASRRTALTTLSNRPTENLTLKSEATAHHPAFGTVTTKRHAAPAEEMAELHRTKRLRTADDGAPLSVLTFAADRDRFARLQLLSDHTLHDLVSALCEYTPVGREGSETATDHLWHVTFDGARYESGRAHRTSLGGLGLDDGVGSRNTLRLTYDYGTTSFYTLTFVGRRSLSSDECRGMFPRNDADTSMPAGYTKYVPSSINGNVPFSLDATFAPLQQWIFDRTGTVVVNLFQAGKKKNHGFMEDGHGGMMYMPAKPSDLTSYVKCFNDGAGKKPKGLEPGGAGYRHYNWHSVVIVPRSKLTDALRRKYVENNPEPGFVDVVVPADAFRTAGTGHDLDTYYPKMAALAGYRKDRRVPKGWVTFTKRGDKCNLVICKGNTQVHYSNAPKGTAYDGNRQHAPVEDPIIEVSDVDVRGLNDLFGVVEGLLRSL